MIRQCKDYLLENYDCKVVYGDTDSVYVKFKTEHNPESKEHMVKIFEISEKAADELSDYLKNQLKWNLKK